MHNTLQIINIPVKILGNIFFPPCLPFFAALQILVLLGFTPTLGPHLYFPSIGRDSKSRQGSAKVVTIPGEAFLNCSDLAKPGAIGLPRFVKKDLYLYISLAQDLRLLHHSLRK